MSDSLFSAPLTRRGLLGLGVAAAAAPAGTATPATPAVRVPSLPDALLTETYEKAARLNVLAAVNPAIFPGYFSVCADGKGFGYGNTYPSLDGHQLTDALVWLGRADVALDNWNYVRKFQRADGCLPLAILPASAGKDIGPKGYPGKVDANGGLYIHWVPGNPLAALAGPTYIQNADVIFRNTLDRTWLTAQIGSINRTADFLASLTTPEGEVKGGGYYIERPPRLDCDGVTQSHAVDAFSRVAALNLVLGDRGAADRYRKIAGLIASNFNTRYWLGDRFAEYHNPSHGFVGNHGLTDSDWAALAFSVATTHQRAVLWPRLKYEERFYYGGMPTGIVTEPDKYEDWEFNYDRFDVSAMGRTWYLESAARAGMGDGEGLAATLGRVCRTGRDNGFYWRERYGPKGGYGAQKYCEYPANLIRIVQRFLLGVDLRLDGTVSLAPVAPDSWWDHGFGQTLVWRGGARVLEYRMRRTAIEGTYAGPEPQRLLVRGKTIVLPAAAAGDPHRFTLTY